MKSVLKRVESIGLALVMILILVPQFAMLTLAAETEEVQVTVTFGQKEARTMLNYINQFRAGNDVDGQKADYWNSDNATKTDLTGTLSPLTYDYSLERTAMQRAVEVALSFDHARPNGERCFTAWEGSWNPKGENIAAGENTAYNTFFQWREDNDNYAGQGHRRNMLSSGFTKIGIGHVVFNGVHFWTHAFGSGTGDAVETPANDSEAVVTVEVLTSDIQNLIVSKTPENYSLKVGASSDLPQVTANFRMAETWPARNFPVQVSPTWTSADSSVAAVTETKVEAKASGSTTLTTQVLGTEVSVPVMVTEGYLLTKHPEVAATCTTDGNAIYWVREKDGAIFADEDGTQPLSEIPVIKAFGHAEVTDPAVAPTCTEPGTTEGSHCSVCGEVIIAQAVVPATEHTAVTDPAVAPTCTEPGKTEGSHCSVCGKVIIAQAVVPATEHTAVTDPAVAPTCTEPGKTEGSHCSVCGKILTEQEEISSRGHSWGKWNVITPATETEDGLEEHVCGNDLSHKESRKIPKLSHIHMLNKVGAKDATCQKEGNIEYWICSDCNRLFRDASGNKEVNAEDVVTARTDHKAGDAVKENEAAATCETNGSCEEVTRCEYCGEELNREPKVIPALGHDWDEGTVIKEATCTEEGERRFTCSRCDATKTEEIPMTAHSPVTVKGRAATYTASGLTDGIKCSVCGKILRAQKPISKLQKKNNPLKVEIASKTFRRSSLKKAKSFKIGATKEQGRVTYALDKKAKKAKIKVSAKGKVTIPKKCKKGTYKITVKAAGNSKYKAGTKTVKIIVK